MIYYISMLSTRVKLKSPKKNIEQYSKIKNTIIEKYSYRIWDN